MPSPPPVPPPSVNPVPVKAELLRAGSPVADADMQNGDLERTGAAGFFNAGAEDAAAGIEQLDHYTSALSRKGLFEGQEGSERPASRASDASSDLEIPTGARREKGGSANKRKRFEKDSDIADELERSVMADRTSHAMRPSGRGKGKGRQMPREHSADSVKGTRRRAAPRRKLDASVSDNPDGLSLGQADVALNDSRPPSPTPMTSIVYEIDQVKPLLKRAKKVDEAARLKRIKALEDAQRKVWTNIARRDVAKVCVNFSLFFFV
jgi:DNA helicase INO80